MSEQTQISDFSERDEKPETSSTSSTPKEKESSDSPSQSSLDEDRVSIATSVWSSPDSEISERISHDVQSEESRRASSTGIKKMSDFGQTDEKADELMKCDDLLKDEAMDLRLDSSFINEERSRTLSWSSLSWDSRTTCWSDRPSSSASSSSANSAMLKVTEEDAGTMMDINAPVEEQHPEETEDDIQAPNSGRLSPSALQEDKIPSPQSQKKAGSVIRVKVRSLCPRPSDDEDSSHQEEAEAGEAKQSEPSDPAPASSKTTISTRGKFFRWMKKNKVHPLEVDLSTGESIKSPDCPPETCSSIEEDTGKVSAETKRKKGNAFTRFFRRIFSKNKKNLEQDKMENGQNKTCAE